MDNQPQSENVNQLDNFFDISFDARARKDLSQAAYWAKIFVICAFVGYGLNLIVVLFGHKDLSRSVEASGLPFYFSTANIAGTIIVILIGVFINYFLLRFANAAGRGSKSMDIVAVNEGFNNLRIYFKIFGILLIIVFSFLALVLLFALISIGIRR